MGKLDNIKGFFKSGPGNKVRRDLASVVLRDMEDFFAGGKAADATVLVTHAEGVLPIATALGLFDHTQSAEEFPHRLVSVFATRLRVEQWMNEAGHIVQCVFLNDVLAKIIQ